uniref:Uncharacterized protein n=1 Tax=Cucumis melo TaxID=3656 RepID=A0A9I9EFT8_CUCME
MLSNATFPSHRLIFISTMIPNVSSPRPMIEFRSLILAYVMVATFTSFSIPSMTTMVKTLKLADSSLLLLP